MQLFTHGVLAPYSAGPVYVCMYVYIYIYIIYIYNDSFLCVHRWHITAWLPAISDHNNETLEKNLSSPNLQTNPTFLQLSIRVVLGPISLTIFSSQFKFDGNFN